MFQERWIVYTVNQSDPIREPQYKPDSLLESICSSVSFNIFQHSKFPRPASNAYLLFQPHNIAYSYQSTRASNSNFLLLRSFFAFHVETDTFYKRVYTNTTHSHIFLSNSAWIQRIVKLYSDQITILQKRWTV